MELIDQHTKKIMEGCKARARDAGLRFQDESLEYIVTNRDLLELTPKVMIPTLYDYWVHDVEVLREKGKYELYPGNPYETVINTRPAISFYNDNNPDWLNVMIFYHVLGHIDFFQNNIFFKHTWEFDFTGQALSDKRLIARLRAEKGRWVDYAIEFARGIDNLVGYHRELSRVNHRRVSRKAERLNFYFDVFLQTIKKVNVSEYIKEVTRYNDCLKTYGEAGEESFFGEIRKQHPEFDELFKKSLKRQAPVPVDLLQFIGANSEFLNKENNRWMKQVLLVVRNTSIFFQPQIRTKIMNEGWASYWHEKLFLQDDRIKGHEIDFARVHAGVTSMPRVGLNPYALGMRLFGHIEKKADKGKYTFDFQKILDAHARKEYDAVTGRGQDYIFSLRENLCDFMFINYFVDQDFVTDYQLFVADRRLNQQKMVWEYYVKSKKAADYRQMLLDTLYHPPFITVDKDKTKDNALYLIHHFEGKPLVNEYIANTMLGIEYLWGGPVHLETSDVVATLRPSATTSAIRTATTTPSKESAPQEIKWQRVVYTMKDRKLSKKVI
ncbi:MAG: SpoVR family protein [Desulfobacterales bacterium]|jgi:stage V sporulation protein R|nr:SpoVR family protein [Desulfobacterales bacterium]